MVSLIRAAMWRYTAWRNGREAARWLRKHVPPCATCQHENPPPTVCCPRLDCRSKG